MLAWIVFYYPWCWGARKLEKMNTGVNKVSLTKNDSVKGSHAVGSWRENGQTWWGFSKWKKEAKRTRRDWVITRKTSSRKCVLNNFGHAALETSFCQVILTWTVRTWCKKYIMSMEWLQRWINKTAISRGETWGGGGYGGCDTSQNTNHLDWQGESSGLAGQSKILNDRM